MIEDALEDESVLAGDDQAPSTPEVLAADVELKGVVSHP